MRLRLLAVAGLLLLAAATGARAADPAQRDIHAFLTSVYSHYKGDTTSYDPMGKIAPKLFTARLVSLLRENQDIAAKKGDSAADADPFCDCQDYTGMKIAIGAIAVSPPADATAAVTLNFSAPNKPIHLRYTFKKERGKWLIDEIASDGGTPSFLGYLQAENKELKAEK